MQCPYCNKTRSGQDDLIWHNIVNHHPVKVVEVQNNPGLIKAVPEETKNKKTKEEAMDKKTRPLPRYVSPAEYRRGRNTTLKFFPFA